MSKNKIPTAEEFLNQKHFGMLLDIKNSGIYPEDIAVAMIEFAKLHVKQALKAARESALDPEVQEFMSTHILKAYPLNNIK